MVLKLFVTAAAIAAEVFPAASIFAQSAQGDRVVDGARRVNGRLVAEKAQIFLASLTPAQRAEAVVPYSFSAASHWSNLPEQDMWRSRPGLSTQTLTSQQWQALNAVLASATGSGKNEGFDEIQQILNADDYISQSARRRAGYGRGQYHIAFLAHPTATGRWQLQFGGHHLALNHTYLDAELVGATPAFRGAEPLRFKLGDVENQPMVRKHEALVNLIASLDNSQFSSARFRHSPGHLVAGPGKDWEFPEKPHGIAASDLSADQRKLLRTAIELYVRDTDEASATKIMAIYDRELDRTYFSFAGSGALSRTDDYVRIDGPSVWIELVMDEPWSFLEPHPHSVWRDKRTDYGGTKG